MLTEQSKDKIPEDRNSANKFYAVERERYAKSTVMPLEVYY
jgi:hypothetical protein